MMTAPGADAGKGIVGDADTPAKAPRARGSPLERAENLVDLAGTSGVSAKPTYLQAAIKKLAVPVNTGTDVALTQAQLEEQRWNILQEAIKVAQIWREFDIIRHEYNQAHGFTPVAVQPSRVGEVRNQGRNLNTEMGRDVGEKTAVLASVVSVDKQRYNTPAKNLRAAQAATAELPSLSGEALRRQ
jgi:hypothetical protein